MDQDTHIRQAFIKWILEGYNEIEPPSKKDDFLRILKFNPEIVLESIKVKIFLWAQIFVRDNNLSRMYIFPDDRNMILEAMKDFFHEELADIK